MEESYILTQVYVLRLIRGKNSKIKTNSTNWKSEVSKIKLLVLGNPEGRAYKAILPMTVDQITFVHCAVETRVAIVNLNLTESQVDGLIHIADRNKHIAYLEEKLEGLSTFQAIRHLDDEDDPRREEYFQALRKLSEERRRNIARRFPCLEEED